MSLCSPTLCKQTTSLAVTEREERGRGERGEGLFPNESNLALQKKSHLRQSEVGVQRVAPT